MLRRLLLEGRRRRLLHECQAVERDMNELW
jgi:hypothetical protein